MDGGFINIKIHHGGIFSKEGVLTYHGGQVSYFRNCDIDRMSFFELVDIAKTVGFMDGDKLYYTIPGCSLEAGINQLHDDRSVFQILEFSKQKNLLEIYIRHVHQGDVSSNPTCGEAIQDVNVEKRILKTVNKRIAKRDKRIWTAEEEKLLIDILHDMNGSGWKLGTGYKSGYLSYIEKEMAKILPNSRLKADPHIKSKVKILKKQLSCILDIQQSGIGFGWDNEKKMVVGDKDTYLGWAKSREGAMPVYMKPIVNYKKLCEVFANDFVKGEKAKVPPREHLEVKEEQPTLNRIQVATQAADESISQTQGDIHTRSSVSTRSRKRVLEVCSLESELARMLKSISSLLEAEKKSALAMNDIKKAFMHEVEVYEQTSAKRNQLFQVLNNLPGLTPDQVVKATRIIGQDAIKIQLFFTVPDNYKVLFVHQEIDAAN